MRGLSGKVALVAGAGGIGEAAARRLAIEGATVVIADIAPDSAERAADAARRASPPGSVPAAGIACDLTDEASVLDLFGCIAAEHGGVDLLDLNAADLSPDVLQVDDDIVTRPLAILDRAIEANLRSHVLCTRAAVPQMIARGGGAIVYISSEAALVGGFRPFYGTSKAAQLGFMRHVAAFYGKRNIRANALSLDMIMTANTKAVTHPADAAARLDSWALPRLGAPDDVAAMIVFLLSDECPIVQGQTLTLNGGRIMR